ncbi:MAG: YbgA family protein [Thermodesulfobacteriota bacterium]
METLISIGISACLAGEQVRYDGGHKRDPFLMETLGPFVRFVPVCPEFECGLGVPREPMRLVGDPARPRLVTIHTKVDLTERMEAWAERKVVELEQENLHGFIFKSRSPSSGMERVKVYSASGEGSPQHKGVGLFARAFMDHFPLLPVEDEGRLHDPALRENFITRIFVLARWRPIAATKQPGELVAFHTRHKLLLLAHSEKHYRQLGRLVAQTAGRQASELFAEYEQEMLAALACRSTIAKNCNVLQHMMGYFKTVLTADEKQELLEGIDHYRQGYVPLLAPLTLINHYVRKYRQEYLASQYYLHPHPMELKLRNHA